MLIAHAVDHGVELALRTRIGSELPALVGREFSAQDARIQAQVWIQSKARCTVGEVGLDFGIAHEAGAPLRVGCIRKGIGVGPYIAGEPRIGMLSPGAASCVEGIENGELAETLTPQFVSGGDTGGAGTDDGYAHTATPCTASAVSIVCAMRRW